MSFEKPEMGISEQSKNEKNFDYEAETGKRIEDLDDADRIHLDHIKENEEYIAFWEGRVGELANAYSQTEDGSKEEKEAELKLRGAELMISQFEDMKKNSIESLGKPLPPLPKMRFEKMSTRKENMRFEKM